MKMDHHCPFVDNCIGFGNYKMFLLLTVYTLLHSLYYVATSAEYVYAFVKSEMDKLRELTFVCG